jgi:DNA-directed RNA polymerase subunit RPC12/RpoP
MIDTVLNLMFRCSHRRLTRPVTPVSKAGIPNGETYVVCLDCGKQFPYDLKEMRIGKAVDRSQDAGVLPPNMPKPRQAKTFAFWAALPLGVLIGAAFKPRPREAAKPEGPGAGEPGKHGDAGSVPRTK